MFTHFILLRLNKLFPHYITMPVVNVWKESPSKLTAQVDPAGVVFHMELLVDVWNKNKCEQVLIIVIVYRKEACCYMFVHAQGHVVDSQWFT